MKPKKLMMYLLIYMLAMHLKKGMTLVYRNIYYSLLLHSYIYFSLLFVFQLPFRDNLFGDSINVGFEQAFANWGMHQSIKFCFHDESS